MIKLNQTLPDLARKLFAVNHFGLHWVRLGILFLLLPSALASQPLDIPVPGDDATYRPTVVVRKGTALGTGTIIGSVEGETLILTAAHVVEEDGLLHVEFFRYNMGWERSRSVAGFPRKVRASIAARDRDTDLAILRVGGQLEFPYVARIAPGNRSIAPGTPVTSIGFDRGERLIGFPTRVKQVERVDMDRGGGDRAFLITEHPPEVGRSGGGLYLKDGTLIGVCLARAQLKPGPTLGMYSTVSSVRRLLASHEDLASVVARSHPVIAATKPPPNLDAKPGGPQVKRTGDRVRAN